MTLNTLLLPTSVGTRLGFRLILQYSLIHLLIGNKVFVETKQFSSLFPPQIKIKNFTTSRPPISSRWRPWPKSPRQTWSARRCGQWTRIRSASIWRYSGPLPSRTRTRQSWRSWRMRSASSSRKIRHYLSLYSIRRKSRRSSSKV